MRLDLMSSVFKNVTRTAAGVCGVGIILGLQQQQAKAKKESLRHLVLYRKRISWQFVPVARTMRQASIDIAFNC